MCGNGGQPGLDGMAPVEDVPTYLAGEVGGAVAERQAYYGPSYPHAELTARIIAAAIEVHRHLGPGFVEPIYELALRAEFEARGTRFAKQEPVRVYYKGVLVGKHRLDMVVEDCVVVELKAVEELSSVHRAQALSYLRATGLEVALLLNFAKPTLREGIARIVCSSTASSASSDPSAPLR